MTTHRIAWLITALLALAGLTLGYRAYARRAEATVVVEWSTASELDTAGFNAGGNSGCAGRHGSFFRGIRVFLPIRGSLVPESKDARRFVY
jgi:hypothetical protein